MNVRALAARRRLVVSLAVGLTVAAGTFVVTPAYAERSPIDRTFRSVDEAADAGAVEVFGDANDADVAGGFGR